MGALGRIIQRRNVPRTDVLARVGEVGTGGHCAATYLHVNHVDRITPPPPGTTVRLHRCALQCACGPWGFAAYPPTLKVPVRHSPPTRVR